MPRIDAFLEIGRQQGASDIHLSVGLPPLIRMDDLPMQIPSRALSEMECTDLLREIVTDEQWATCTARGAVDLSYEAETGGRFRMNIFHRSGGLSAVCRIIPETVPSMAELGLP